MPSKTLYLWARCGGKAAAPGPQKESAGAAVPPPHPHRLSRVINMSYAVGVFRAVWRDFVPPSILCFPRTAREKSVLGEAGRPLGASPTPSRTVTKTNQHRQRMNGAHVT